MSSASTDCGVLSVAGFDASGGAGLIADAKTFDTLGCIGYAVATAMTVQNAEEIQSVRWESLGEIRQQIEVLAQIHPIRAAKIGIIENQAMLDGVTSQILESFGEVPIVWDPIFAASSEYVFHEALDLSPEMLSAITVITPNAHEIERIALEANTEWQEAARSLAEEGTAVCVTGIEDGDHVTNILFDGSDSVTIRSKKLQHKWLKHGSGCVFSSAIAAQLAQGESLATACSEATEYTHRFLQSVEGKLGLHQQSM